MKCECCGLDDQAGERYAFFYGNMTGSSSRGKIIITNYKIAGTQMLFLCDACVARHSEMSVRKMGIVITAMLLLIPLCFLGLSLGGGIAFADVKPLVLNMLWMPLIGPFMYLARRLVGKRAGAKAGMGDSLAIKLRKPELKKAGFNSFFDREAYKRMGGSLQA
jgi:hypothetical protein